MSDNVMRNAEGYFDPTAGTAIKNILRAKDTMKRSRTIISIKRGDIYYISHVPTVGDEIQTAGRPGIIVSNDILNAKSEVFEVVYLTSQPKKDLPTHTTVRSSGRVSTAICEQISNVSLSRIGEYIGTVTKDEMSRIDTALMISLGIEEAPEQSKMEDRAHILPQAMMIPPNSGIEPSIDAEKIECKAQLEVYKKLYFELLERITEKG